jgi:hypothetical protein
LRKFLDGFYWGLGFSIALVSVFASYTVVGHIAIERNYQKSMDQLLSENLYSFVDALQLKLVDSKVVDNEVLVTTQIDNLGITPNSLGLTLRFSLYTESGKFMGQCEDEIPSTDSKEDKIHIVTACKSKLYPVNEFYKATVAVLNR